METELAEHRQHQHYYKQPEKSAFQGTATQANQHEPQQLGRTGQANPADQRDQLAGQHAGQLTIGQRGKKNRGDEIANRPQATDPQRQRYQVKRFGKTSHVRPPTRIERQALRIHAARPVPAPAQCHPQIYRSDVYKRQAQQVQLGTSIARSIRLA